MIQFFSLSSGSSGNCYYLGNGSKGILIDSGVSVRRLKRIFQDYGLSVESISAVLVTHDHMDHVRNIGSYCKHLCRPVYTRSTIHKALSYQSTAVPHIHSCRQILPEDEVIEIAGFKVRWFQVPHDSTDNIGYFIECEDHKIAIMTDVGKMTREAVSYAKQADTIIIESNYDLDMLMHGPYTEELKRRIRSGFGHLSNDECAQAIKLFWHDGIKHIFLCHLSENNNTPQLAFDCANKALSDIGIPKGVVDLRALPRTTPSPVIEL